MSFVLFPTRKEKTLNPNTIENFDTLTRNAAKDHTVLLGSYKNHAGTTYGNAFAAHDLTNPLTAHVLIEGRAGAGKSVLVENYLRTADQFPDEFSVLYLGVRNSYSGEYPKTNAAQVIETLDNVGDELVRRQSVLEKAKVSSINELEQSDSDTALPRLIVVIDGFDFFLREADYSGRNLLTHRIESIVRLGRALGVHLIATTQSERSMPYASSTDLFPSVIRFRADGVLMANSGEAVWEVDDQTGDVFSVFSDL